MNIQKIAVLVSVGRHPVSGVPRYNRNDGLALSLALQMADTVKAEADVMHAGSPDNPALLDYLALGAKKIQVLQTSGEIVPALAARLDQADLILTGSRAENDEDSGLLPYLLADALSRPVVANVLTIKVTANGVEVLQFLPKGKRRRICIQQPAIIVIHPLADVELRYAYARQLSGKITTISAAEQTSSAHSRQLAPARKTVKLKAKETKAGHARMLSAIASESKGGIVVIDGKPVEKAQVIFAYLREHRLIDF